MSKALLCPYCSHELTESDFRSLRGTFAANKTKTPGRKAGSTLTSEQREKLSAGAKKMWVRRKAEKVVL
jgi:hypothetical protein